MNRLDAHPQRAATRFDVPPELAAVEPPEARGLARDEVRLLVAASGRPVRHRRFTDLPAALAPGDLVVVNTSSTAPAAVDGRRRGHPITLHVAGPVPDRADLWVVELRTPDGHRVTDAGAGEQLTLPGGVVATLVAPYPDVATDPGRADPPAHPGVTSAAGPPVPTRSPSPAGSPALAAPSRPRESQPRLDRSAHSARTQTPTRPHAAPDSRAVVARLDGVGRRLWEARVPVEGGVPGWLAVVGRPIRYSYLRGHWPLASYQTVFSTPPVAGELGSAEMPSAGRPFNDRVLERLRRRGVRIAEIVLHTGVSSPEAGEAPLPERFRVPAATAALVNATRSGDGRVVAVGTTVTRALETVADERGRVHAGAGWTGLVLGPDRPARVVDGLITGWHEPEASHLLLLEAVAGTPLVQRAYRAAVPQRYLWHEFGDSCLLLP